MDKRVPIKTIYLLMVISIGLIGLAFGSTFAMFEASATIDNPISISSNLTYSDKVLQTVNVSLSASETKEVTLNIDNTTENTMYYKVWYLDEDQDIDFGTEDDTSGSVSGVTTSTLTINIRNNTTEEVNVLIGVSTSTSSLSDITLDTDMELIPVQSLPRRIITINQNLATYITNLYTNATKTEVDNGDSTNGIVTYNVASSVGLMNDRLGSMSTSIDGGNIRYYGGNPNNYIYFNCNDYENQDSSTCELWRIIGVFDMVEVDEDTQAETTKKMVKIIRVSSIGKYSWDTSPSTVNSGWGINQWGESTYTTDSSVYSGADLMKLLNPNYDTNTDLDTNGNTITVNNSLYWNRSSGTCYTGGSNTTTICDLTSSGLKNTSTKNKIANVIWNTGGTNSYNLYSHQMYLKERGTAVRSSSGDNITRTTTWTGKVAIAYPSDFGYAYDFTICTVNLATNNNTACNDTNYIYKNYKDSKLLTHYTNGGYVATGLYSLGGIVQSGSGSAFVRGNAVTYPVLYLTANTSLYTGSGTEEEPYQIK